MRISDWSSDVCSSDLEFLADDLLEGRDIGSRGHEIAARYVASEFDALGLKPAGDDGTWYQRITFQKTSPGETPPTLSVPGPGGAHDFAQGQDLPISPHPPEPAGADGRATCRDRERQYVSIA